MKDLRFLSADAVNNTKLMFVAAVTMRPMVAYACEFQGAIVTVLACDRDGDGGYVPLAIIMPDENWAEVPSFDGKPYREDAQ